MCAFYKLHLSAFKQIYFGSNFLVSMGSFLSLSNTSVLLSLVNLELLNILLMFRFTYFYTFCNYYDITMSMF